MLLWVVLCYTIFAFALEIHASQNGGEKFNSLNFFQEAGQEMEILTSHHQWIDWKLQTGFGNNSTKHFLGNVWLKLKGLIFMLCSLKILVSLYVVNTDASH